MLVPTATGPMTARATGAFGQHPRVFGGLLLAHLTMTAAASAHQPSRPHSLHAHFLVRGTVTEEISYESVALRRSRRFSTFRTDAVQAGTLLATAAVSFHSDEVTTRHAPRMPTVDLPPERCRPASGGPIPPPDALIRAPYDLRHAEGLFPATRDGRPVVGYWLRTREKLGPDPALNAAALAWASDFTLTRIADLEHESEPGTRRAASLDHAMWFHRPFRADEWLLYELTSPVYQGALALSTGRFFDLDGNLVATVTQESLLRR
ncbi:acyl-CoA thioesterase [Acrocarpospora catenulata]|uniref:acyl-CoA thioesterase n=1 Tax=Acrocarpospora catenulata TaxID=2836182 RepID=UPI001BDA86BF|nr:acyl-CoA thioesterase domain-containing protein [Acrocarpospora catenulata]